MTYGEHVVERDEGGCVVLAYRDRRGAPGMWIGCDDPAAVTRLATKLPHYNRYGFLAFEGADARNTARLELPVLASPLVVDLATGGPGPLPAPRVDAPLSAE